nr:Common central domain of tyrosinase [uncultured organism]
MTRGVVNRRNFMQQSAMLLGASAIAPRVLGQTTALVRPEWQSFKTTPRYDALIKAVKSMKANTNVNDPKSWSYWTNIHLKQCPHSVPYFFAWHRGYLYYFKRQLRTVSGDPRLVLPYWDYYTNPVLPAEFTNPNGGNPLYIQRVNTNVRQALTMAPFSSALINFPRNTANAFEPSFEDMPHNPVHDLIGNWMANMQSPTDPIFWLHHANVDRLWVAWVNAGGGRAMPALNKPYWSGSHTYTSSLTMPRSSTYSTRTALAYSYPNESFPTRLPLAQLAPANVHRVQATPEDLQRTQPPAGAFRLSPSRQTGEQTFAIGGALDVGLDDRSISVQLPVSAEHTQTLARIAAGSAAPLPGSAKLYRSVHLVLDDIEVTEAGKEGGYYYQVYLNIPVADGAANKPRAILIGTLGAFKISGAAHHHGGPVQLRYPIARAAFANAALRAGTMSVSFVRVSGDQSPKGGVIGLGEVRLETSTEDKDS